MTAQINDVFIYNRKNYELVAIENPNCFFDFKKLDIKPVSENTANWRGYVAWFAIDKNMGLVLKKLKTNNGDDPEHQIPEINGKTPVVNNASGWPGVQPYQCLVYNNINLPLTYTGGVLVAREFLRDYYVHQGFQGAWAYEIVIELVFQDGKHIVSNDMSQAAANKRAMLAPGDAEKNKCDNLLNWINDRYDLSYLNRWD